MQYAILGILIVLVIGFFVVLWKAARTWRWFHIVTALFTMLLAVAFIFPTAGALKSRSEWHKVKETLEVRAEKAYADYKTIKFGDSSDPDSSDGLDELRQKLTAIGIEAGRVWRSLELRSGDLNAITLTGSQDNAVIPPDGGVDGAAAPAAAPAPVVDLVPKGLVVYCFYEKPAPNTNMLVPSFYLGEFLVVDSTPTQVTLKPTAELEEVQKQVISSGQANRWSVYEMLPLDGHEMFIADGSLSSEESLLGRVDATLLDELFQGGVSEETKANYLRDGTQAVASDPPMSRWSKIEFLKKYKLAVDAKSDREATDGGFFDGTGRAVDARLKRNEEAPEVEYKIDEQIVIKEEAANELRETGVAKLIKTYYLRPLNDYRFVLRRIRLRLTQLEIRAQQVAFQKTEIQEAIRATDAMLTEGQKDKLKLEQDLSQTEIERKAIAEYEASMSKQVELTRKQLVELYNENQKLEKELEAIHLQIKNRIDTLTSVSP